MDVSDAALVKSRAVLERFQDISIISHHAAYEAGLKAFAERDDSDGPALVAFLGSNIGNFDAADADDLLRAIRAALRPGDALLLGADLVKPDDELLAAYDDPLGVTAAVNLNVLARINRELDADFALGQFAHRAVWNRAASRIEMHLVSTSAQRVRIAACDDLALSFEPGDYIWTESSYKYTLPGIRAALERTGFQPAEIWTHEGFALTLSRVG